MDYVPCDAVFQPRQHLIGSQLAEPEPEPPILSVDDACPCYVSVRPARQQPVLIMLLCCRVGSHLLRKEILFAVRGRPRPAN